MNTINLMATGAFYACGQDEKQCRVFLEHLENDRPRLVLVMQNNPDYGIMIDVEENSRKMASIGRLDIGTALSAMRLEGEEMLIAEVESINYEGRYFTLRIDVEGEVESSIYSSCDWSGWDPLDLPLLSPSGKVQEVCSASRALKSLMRKGRKENAALMTPYLDALMANCRCDMTKETQDTLRMARGYLEQCKDETLHGYAKEIVHATNGLGSEKRELEFGDYWSDLVESNEALVMESQWMMLQKFDGTDETRKTLIRHQLEAIEDNLRQLPNRLFFAINNPARLLHLLVYAYIPREKFRSLLSMLVLRERIRETLTTPLPNPPHEGEGMDTPEEVKVEGAEEDGEEEISFNEMIARAIDSTFFKMRINKKEFKILYRLVNEKYNMIIPMTMFAQMIRDYCSFAEDYMPTWNNMRQLDISETTTYPNWKFHDVTNEKKQRYMTIAETFLGFLR